MGKGGVEWFVRARDAAIEKVLLTESDTGMITEHAVRAYAWSQMGIEPAEIQWCFYFYHRVRYPLNHVFWLVNEGRRVESEKLKRG